MGIQTTTRIVIAHVFCTSGRIGTNPNEFGQQTTCTSRRRSSVATTRPTARVDGEENLLSPTNGKELANSDNNPNRDCAYLRHAQTNCTNSNEFGQQLTFTSRRRCSVAATEPTARVDGGENPLPLTNSI